MANAGGSQAHFADAAAEMQMANLPSAQTLAPVDAVLTLLAEVVLDAVQAA